MAISFFYSFAESQLLRSYGIKGGMSSTTETWSYTPQIEMIVSYTARQGVDIGIYAEWFSMSTISLLTEVCYIQKNEDFSEGKSFDYLGIPLEEYYSFQSKVNYLSLPILVKLRINWGVAVPYVIIGPRFYVYLSGNNNTFSNDFREIDVGGTFGFGVESLILFPIGAEIRYSPTFTNSPTFLTGDPGSNTTIKNQSFEFLIVISF